MGKESGMGRAEGGTDVPSRQVELSAGNPIIIKELQFILAASD